MDLGKFVKELFRGDPSAVGGVAASKPARDHHVLKQTATTESTPEKTAPQRLPRMNTQEMRRLLSQIDFGGSIGSDSHSAEKNLAPEQDAGRQYLESLSQHHQTPRIRGFWDDDLTELEGDLSSLEKQDAIEELEREFDNQVSQTPIVCKPCSDSKGPSTFNGESDYGQNSSVGPTPLTFRTAGGRKELNLSDQALKRAEVLLGTGVGALLEPELQPFTESSLQSREGEIANDTTFISPGRHLRGSGLPTLDELNALDAPAPPLAFASAGIFFSKASGKGSAPLVINDEAMQKARLMFQPSPEKTEEVRPGSVDFDPSEGFSSAAGWSTAGLAGNFLNFKGNLQPTKEALAKAKNLLDSPEKKAMTSAGQENSLNTNTMPAFGFGKASTWGNNLMTSNLMLTDEAMEKARKLLDGDATSDDPEVSNTMLFKKPKLLQKDRQEPAGNLDQREAKSKGGFSSSSNPSKSVKSTLGIPKRSGAFVAPKQIRPLTDPLGFKNPRFPLPKGSFRDPTPLAGLSRDNQLRMARPRTSAFTNKLQINFEKYKNMSLTIAKRFKNKAVCPSFQKTKLSNCPGSQFISVEEIYELCKPLLHRLTVKTSEELVRELTAELRLQADKFEQSEEYVAHHLHMLSRKYITQLHEASRSAVVSKMGLQSASEKEKLQTAILSEMLTDLYCRYKREEFLGSKSPLRLLREGSINQERRVCLMIKKIIETPAGFTLELTDGWYIVYYKLAATPALVASIKDSPKTKPKLDASNDELILRLILFEKIQVGTKLEVSNLGVSVVAPEKLDEYKVWEPAECKIHYNSLKRCTNQRTKLGLIYSFPKPTRLENLYLHGGPVPLLDVLIVAKKGIKIFGGVGVEYLTMSDHQLSEEPPSVSFALVVIDTLHVSTDYSTKSVVYHELQLKYQSLPAYLSYEIGQRVELSNYKVAKRLGTPLVMNFRQQYERGFLLQEQKRNCIQPKELPRTVKKSLPMYKLLLESRISQRLTLDELAMTYFVPEIAKPKTMFAYLSIAANYVTHGKQEALFHVYRTHFIQVRYQSYDDYKLAQAKKAAAQASASVRDPKTEVSCASLPNPLTLDAEKQAFWRRFIHKTSSNERSHQASDPDERSRAFGSGQSDEMNGTENSYANLVPPIQKPQVQHEPRIRQEEQTVAVASEQRVADPLVVFFDLICTGTVNTIEISKKTKVYIHQCNFEPPGSFVLGSNFISEFCETDSFEKYLLLQYQQGVQSTSKDLEGGLKPLLARMQRYQLS